MLKCYVWSLVRDLGEKVKKLECSKKKVKN